MKIARKADSPSQSRAIMAQNDWRSERLMALKKPILKGLVVAAVATLALGALSGCSGLTGGVAATVNGVEIQEDDITRDIQDMREQRSLMSESSWGEWMAEYNYIPAKVRDDILDTYINNEVLHQEAAALDIAVEQSEIDEYVDQMKSKYGSQEEWEEALDQVGMTEDDYRENIENNLYKQKIEATLDTSDVDPTDPLAYAQSYLTTLDGAKRSSHILFDAADEATAQDVLNRIRSGELDFAAAAQEYSQDGSGESGGDVGWDDPVNTFVTEYQTALDGLAPGQVSDLVPSQYGIHIIKCTEQFTAPAELTSLDQLPDGLSDYVTAQASSVDADSAYNTWLEEKRHAAEITVNPMPENVPYNVDMSKYVDAETLKALEESTEEQRAEFLGEEVTEEAEVDAVAEDAEAAAEGEGSADATGDGTIQFVDAEGNALDPVSGDSGGDGSSQ